MASRRRRNGQRTVLRQDALGDRWWGRPVPAKDLEFDGVVGVADEALQSKPVVLRRALCAAVIAQNGRLRVLELGRHWLALYGHVKVAKLGLHIAEALVADRTLVRGLFVLLITFPVDAVAAGHKDEGLRRGKHVVAADGAVAVC